MVFCRNRATRLIWETKGDVVMSIYKLPLGIRIPEIDEYPNKDDVEEIQKERLGQYCWGLYDKRSNEWEIYTFCWD